MDTNTKRIQKIYLIDINTKGYRSQEVRSNLKKATKHIHEHLEQHYLDYNVKDYYKHQTLIKYMRKSKTKEIKKQTRNSYITIKQFIIK